MTGLLLRQSMAWPHRWAGLSFGWLLYFMFLTGTTGYFAIEIDRWMQPERPLASAVMPVEKALMIALQRLQQDAPQAERWFIGLPDMRQNLDIGIAWRAAPKQDGTPGVLVRKRLDPATGQTAAYRATGGGQFLYRMHYQLHYLPAIAAYWIVGFATMLFLIALVTGIVIHRRIFRDFFTLRIGRGPRTWLDLHNILSVFALPFHLMIAYSGLVFLAFIYMAPVIAATYGAGSNNQRQFVTELLGRANTPLETAGAPATLTPFAPVLAEVDRQWGPQQIQLIDIRYPGRENARIRIIRNLATPSRVRDELVFDGVSGKPLQGSISQPSFAATVRTTLFWLHEAQFAHPLLRWLYFISGLMGAGAIATGMVLWTSKQIRKSGDSRLLRIFVRINVAVIAGLPVAIGLYFYANRLIPASFDGRAAWEGHALFAGWLAMLLHAMTRPSNRLWAEQMGIAALVYACIPALNALTSDRHIAITIAHGDWVLAGLDLTALAIGAGFAIASWSAFQRIREGLPHRAQAKPVSISTSRNEIE